MPRLCAWFECPEMVTRMRYRCLFEHIPDQINDIFDGKHYQSLCDKHVIIEDKRLNHKFFSDQRDIALGLSTDGFQVCYISN